MIKAAMPAATAKPIEATMAAAVAVICIIERAMAAAAATTTAEAAISMLETVAPAAKATASIVKAPTATAKVRLGRDIVPMAAKATIMVIAFVTTIVSKGGSVLRGSAMAAIVTIPKGAWAAHAISIAAFCCKACCEAATATGRRNLFIARDARAFGAQAAGELHA